MGCPAGLRSLACSPSTAARMRAASTPRLTVAQILDWADAYYAATGQWPVNSPCAVTEAPGVTWEKIDMALRRAVAD